MYYLLAILNEFPNETSNKKTPPLTMSDEYKKDSKVINFQFFHYSLNFLLHEKSLRKFDF